MPAMWISSQSVALFLLWAVMPLSIGASYNRPECSTWPAGTLWQDLSTSLTDGQLNGPFVDDPLRQYVDNCIYTEQNNQIMLGEGQGLCMHRHRCSNQYCEDEQKSNLPAYSVTVQSVDDLQKALAFATQHNIAVSVKSSGHSYVGQSMLADSLLLWMRHFPIPAARSVTTNFTDSCGTTTPASVAVAGGENFNSLMNTVRDRHHIVTGSCQTVVLGGGWLLGGGMSKLHRRDGYGIDHALSFDVVLANGTLVTADACNDHADLFWALRGGGPGFGIITSVQYGLLPPTKVVLLETEYVPRAVRDPGFLVGTFNRILEILTGYDNVWNYLWGGETEYDPEFTKRWIGFMVDQVPNLEREWGGTIGALQAELHFAGSLEEARNSDFAKALDAWYDANNGDLEFNYAKPSEMMEEYDSWYDHLGGEEAYQNPDFAAGPSNIPSALRDTFSRVIPKRVFDDKPEELKEILIELFTNDIESNSNYLMGGAPNDVAANETAIHPNMREAILEVEIATSTGAAKLRQFLEGYDTSVCYNHHSAEEPDWRNQCWGSNYERLEEIKNKYDPLNLFNTFHGVGYTGVDFDNDNDSLYDTATCQRNDEIITDFSFYAYSWVNDARGALPFLSPLWWLVDHVRRIFR